MDTYAAFFVISAIGIMYAMISLAITKRFGNRERVKQIQKDISDITKKQQAAIKKNDEAELKRLEAENARIPALLKESMIMQFKPLIFLLPFLLVLPALARMLYPDFVITLPFQLPVFIQHFERFPNWRSEFGAVGWFWLAFLFSSLMAQALVDRLPKMVAKMRGKTDEKPKNQIQESTDIIQTQKSETILEA
ncbi:MAG: EMC3/TMCO1 family protein [Candidatus Burarchaeum sp.]|nr:EMC3/TMCO1 family protein [Candidatus Burarchaeum sp.]MDO8339384.1 EMC3/TMCO1 family protein [Candidatus Burarchaeum sp.]